MTLAVHRFGTRGPNLVLLHGRALDSRVFEPLIERWRDRFSIHAIDLPGHGESPWALGTASSPEEQRSPAVSAGPVAHECPDVSAWAVQIAPHLPSDALMLGWSLGGLLSLELARTVPQRIRRLLLVATTPHFLRASEWPMGASSDSVDRLHALLRQGYLRMAEDFLDLQVRGSQNAAAVLARLRQHLRSGPQPQMAALEGGLDLLRTADLRPALAGIAQSTLTVAGQYDRVVSPAATTRLAALMPNARAVTLRRAAHAPFLSHTDEFVALAEPFLTGAATADADHAAHDDVPDSAADIADGRP